MRTGKTKILMVTAIYSPPVCGAGYIAQLLKGSRFAEEFDLSHVNTRFVDSVSDLEKIHLKKLVLFAWYFLVICAFIVWKRPDFVIICPGFAKGTFFKDSIYTLVCTKLFGRRVLWWIHPCGLRRLYDASGPPMRRWIQWVIKSVYRVVIISEHQRSDFDFVCSQGQLFTISHGIPASQFSLSRFDSRREIRVLYFSNLSVFKGWRILLEAAKHVCNCRDGIFFDFYGNPTKDSSQEVIEEAFRNSGFTNRICYHGAAYGTTKHQAYDRADVFCFIPDWRFESFGLVLLEAMNAGLPVISTEHPTNSDVIIGECGGFLIPKEDPAVLSDAILRLAGDSELRKRMGEYNRQRFYEHFTADKFADRWVEFIHSLAADNGKGG